MTPTIKILTAKSKAGREYTYILVKFGDYEGRLFPTPGEVAYIKMLSAERARKDFKESVENDED